MMSTVHPDYGLSLLQSGNSIETVLLKGIELSLVASGDGTEIIRHKLTAGTRWAIIPEDGWSALEYLLILKGSLKWQRPDGESMLSAGDSIVAHPIRKHSIFIAETNVEFLYVSSQPVFHHYSSVVRELKDLAVTVEQKDGYTAEHCQRIVQMAMMVGEAMSLGSTQLYELNFGAFFHDIGKVQVPESILCKPGKLTMEEWEIMRMHTIYGRDILRGTDLPFLQASSTIVEQHHERYNGSGYPYGLGAKDMVLNASIVAVVDSYDAMTSNRVYQIGRSKEDALGELRNCREILFHPDVVDIFLSLSDKFDI